MHTVQLEFATNWPTGLMLKELFAAFGDTPLQERIVVKDGYGATLTLTRALSGDISFGISTHEEKSASATFVTAGGGNVLRRTNLALLLLMHAIAADQAEQKH